MAEQISRRAQNVTNAQFEGPFETHTVRFGKGTLNLKDSLDAMEGWSRHTNIWHEMEGEATARPGQTVVATHGAGTSCHSIRKMRDPDNAVTTRFWGIDGTIHMGLTGATSPVASGFSGDPLALLPHRPPLSGEPWLFVGDRLKMAKIRADGLALPIGLPIPATPPATALGTEFSRVIAMFDSGDSTPPASWVPVAGTLGNDEPTEVPMVGSSIPGPIAGTGAWFSTVVEAEGTTASLGITTLTPKRGPIGTSVTIAGTDFGATQGTSTVTFKGTPVTTVTSWSDTSIVVEVPDDAQSGNVVVTVGGVASNARTFTVTEEGADGEPGGEQAETVSPGYDSWWGLAVSRDLTTLTEVSGPGPDIPASDEDVVHVWMKTSHPHLLEEIRLYVVVSATFDPEVLPGTDPGVDDTGAPTTPVNSDAYVKAFRPNDYVQYVAAETDQVTAAETARINALRDRDALARGYDDTRASWEDRRAMADPERAPSFQLGLGSQQWFGYGLTGSALRRGDFQRIGGDQTRDWATVTGLIVYVRVSEQTAISIGIDDWYITGGHGPDTTNPGMQPYDYKVTNYDPRTGAESNGSDEQAPDAVLDPVRRHIIITPPAFGDSGVRQRIYRRGGTLIDDWYFVGENEANGAPFTDTLSDAELAATSTLHIDHYQPVPTVDEDGTTVLAQPLHALWGPVEGMLFGCGDPYRPGHVYFCIAGQPDHWSANGNVEVCPPSEELMNGGISGHQAFVFSRLRMYFLYPNLSGGQGVTAAPSLCTRGLIGRWAFCHGPGGLIFFVAEDGVFATSGGPEEWLSEAINPLFYGFAVNGYLPIDKAYAWGVRLTVWENDLFIQYVDVAGTEQVLVYSLLQKFWRQYHFSNRHMVLQAEAEDVLLMGGYQTGATYEHSGTSDDGAPIPCIIRTGSASGGSREEKLFGDLFLDADPSGASIDVQVFLNEETHTNLAIPVSSGSAGRQRFLLDPFGPSPQKAHSIACELRWSTAGAPPTIFQLGYAITLQPDITSKRVTNWDDLNSPDEVWLTGLTLDCDTGGLDKTILIERDFHGERLLVDEITVNAANRHKFKFSWPALPANMVRLRPDPLDCVPWLLYRADWIYVQEPPRIAKWDIHFENEWDQYYTGLDLYCDTLGEEKIIEVWVDEVRLSNPATSEPFWRVVADGRKVVHLTLPWGRGHVFRFLAIDEFPGLLYTHRWHLQPEPSEQTNWNQNFSILGTRADKWLKAIVLECDTYGADKAVQVEVDGTVVETLTVNTTGRRVVQLALTQQALGRVWRLFPVDANPGRLYSAEPLFDEEPFQLDRWETQETNHGLAGWFYPLYAHITLKSTAEVTLTTVVQHNQVGGTTTHAYAIPSTSGQKQRRFLHGFHAGKGVLIKYLLTSAEPFWLYRDETTVVLQPWGAARAVTVQPFGNDDLDPSRPMTHAVLAAQASGGAPTGAPA